MPVMEHITKIESEYKNKDILSLSQFDKKSLELLFQKTDDLQKHGDFSNILKGALATLLFFEPSSRTFGSFAAGVKLLGGNTLEFQNPGQTSSSVKGETLEDSIRVFSEYSDIIVLRHPDVGAATRAAQASNIPVINAGDGVGEHPTQALLDLYTISSKSGRLENLTIVLAGDMKNGRTVHSLLKGLSFFKNNTVYLLSPKTLKLPESMIDSLTEDGLTIHEIDSESDVPKNADVWYWTRIQKERFSDHNEYEKVKNTYIVTPEFLHTYGNETLVLMHPLPRVGEITPEVDADKRAIYFSDQIKNGLFIRMTLISLVLGRLK